MIYYTSDNSKYIDPDLDALKKHCIDNGIKLYNQDKQEVELKSVKTKNDATTNG